MSPQLTATAGFVPLGEDILLDGRISWTDSERRGTEPLNCYLLTSSTGNLIIDTGVALHTDHILREVQSHLEAGSPLAVFFSRMESDTVGNLGALADLYDLHTVYAAGVTNPFDFFDDVNSSEMVGGGDRLEIMRHLPDEPVAWSGTAQPLQLINTPLRLLSTSWAYDANSKTIFTSDSFGHLYSDVTGQVVGDSQDEIIKHLLTRYEWLENAHTENVRDGVADIFAGYDIERIAPTHGHIIQGRSAVHSTVQAVLRAIKEVSAS